MLRNVSTYHEPTQHFDGKFVNGQGHARANVQRAPSHGHFEVKNSAYHPPYDLVDKQSVCHLYSYKIRKYDSTGTEHNYLISCGLDDNHCGVCFLKEKRQEYMV